MHPFDFGLTETEEARAAKLHRESIVFDWASRHAGGAIFTEYSSALRADLEARIARAHDKSQVLDEVIHWPFEMATLGRSDLIRHWLQSSGLTCGVYELALHMPEDARDALSWDWETRINRYARSLPWLRYVRTASEIREAKREGAVALFANCQPIIPGARDLKIFDSAYEKGLRSFMLTYNRMDHIGVGCTERVDAGLSMFGIELVKHLNELGVLIDTSHCGHATTMDACRHSRKPVTANHTAARGVFDHARGKSDNALRAIAGTGGVIGVVSVPSFLSSEMTPTLDHMLNHIDYIADLVGWEHVAIGTDWPWPVPHEVLVSTVGIEAPKHLGFRPQDRVDRTKRLLGLEDCRYLPNLTRGLVKRGYTDEQIKGILGENSLRVFDAVCSG